jgi:hypothetical protein
MFPFHNTNKQQTCPPHIPFQGCAGNIKLEQNLGANAEIWHFAKKKKLYHNQPGLLHSCLWRKQHKPSATSHPVENIIH